MFAHVFVSAQSHNGPLRSVSEQTQRAAGFTDDQWPLPIHDGCQNGTAPRGLVGGHISRRFLEHDSLLLKAPIVRCTVLKRHFLRIVLNPIAAQLPLVPSEFSGVDPGTDSGKVNVDMGPTQDACIAGALYVRMVDSVRHPVWADGTENPRRIPIRTALTAPARESTMKQTN